MTYQSIVENRERKSVRYYQGRKYSTTVYTQTVAVFDQANAHVHQQLWRHVHTYGTSYHVNHYKRDLVRQHYSAAPF